MKPHPRHRELQPFHDGDRRVAFEIVYDQNFDRPGVDVLTESVQGGRDVLAFVIDRDNNRKRRIA